VAEVPPRHAIPRRVASLVECDLIEELLLHVPDSAVALSLNATARAVWELCDGHRTIETIASDLTQRFQASPDEILAAVQDVVQRLVHLGFIKPPTASDSPGAGP
jgi:hypothetical protein